MSYFDDASLVMIPSGYKTSKVYSVKPTDGSGDLTFSRSNDTATRVNSAGLIEKVRTNLNLYSEQFDNAYWVKLASSVTANAGTAPDGTTTADKIIPNTTNTNHLVYSGAPAPLSAGEYSMSVYVKASGYSKIALRESQSVGFFASFDLTNGTILDSSSNQTNTITSVGDGWYRITSTRSFAGNIALGLIPLLNSYTSGDPFSPYAGDGTSGILVWGAQMEFDVPTEYIGPTLGSAVSVGPVANVPRLDYLNSSCPRLLLEPQRTNLLFYSEQFNNAWWTNSGNIVANTATSPSGYQDADTGGAIGVYPSAGVGDCTIVNTASIFAKANPSGASTLNLGMNRYGFGDFITCTFNLATGTAGTVTTGGTASGASAKIEDYGNGWYRCSITGIASSSAGTLSFNPNNTCFIWGAQLEAGAYATSYIPTLGAAVTRGADAASKTGISSLIGQTEGTLFIDMEFEAYDNLAKWIAFLGTGSSYIGLYTDNVSRFVAEVANTTAQFLNSTFVFAVGQRYKLALAYKENDFAFYVNGTQVATDNSGTVPATSQFDFQYNTTANNLTARTYNQALLFKTRLSNADLAALTA